MVRKIYYVVIPLLIAGVSIGYTSFAMALIALLPLLFMTTRHTAAIFLVMYGGPLGGVIRAMYPSLPIYGLLFVMIGLVLMRDLISDLLRHHLKAVGGVLLTLAAFGLFYLLGPRTEFASSKFLSMCSNGLLMVFGYYAFEKSKKIDAEGLSQILLVSSICMSIYVIHAMALHPAGLFNYDWFREQSVSYSSLNNWETDTIVNYQHIGMLVLFSISIFLSQKQLSVLPTLFYVICSTQLVLVSGARQAILGVFLVIILRFTVFRLSNVNTHNTSRKIIKTIFWLAIAGVILLFVLQNLNVGVVQDTMQEGDQGRMIRYLEALAIFSDHPILGSGLGGYESITGEGWPHNFFLELLCETGVVGTLIFILILLFPMIRNKQDYYHLTSSGMFFFLILLGLFVRVLVSADFRESIELFSAIFAITATGASRISKTMRVSRNRQL